MTPSPQAAPSCPVCGGARLNRVQKDSGAALILMHSCQDCRAGWDESKRRPSPPQAFDLGPIPMIVRATGRTIPDLTGREHICEWQRAVRCAEPLDAGREREAAIASAKELPPSKTFSSHLDAYVAGWLARARAWRKG